MRVAILCSLPFHQWVLDPIREALVERGARVEVLVHRPRGPHDWLSDESPAAQRLRAIAPVLDYVIVADAPYEPIRAMCSAPIVATRHSLAGRNNTWDPMHGQADYVVAWSRWDAAELVRRGVTPARGVILAGCPWAAPLARYEGEPGRARARQALLIETVLPVVAWAPSFDADLSRRGEVVAALRAIQTAAHVVVRPHPAIVWREPAWVTSLTHEGFSVDAHPEDSPVNLLAASDLIVGDVSGVLLLAAAVPESRLQILQVDVLPETMVRHPRVDVSGPEWRYRDEIGRCVRPGESIEAAITDALTKPDAFRAQRRAFTDRVLGGPVQGHEARTLVSQLESLA